MYIYNILNFSYKKNHAILKSVSEFLHLTLGSTQAPSQCATVFSALVKACTIH